MLPDMIKISLSLKLGKLFAVRVDHPYHTIVEVYIVVRIYKPHIIGPVLVDISGDEINVVFILEYHIIKKPKGNFAEFHSIFPCLYNSFPFLLGNYL